jgi:5,10-methylenetetrahydromethanopterin reductase
MKFGVRLIQHLGTPRDIVELGILADRAGFDHAWFPSDKFMYHAWAIIGALAEHTKRIIIGPNGTEPYSVSPGETATFMATLDHLSGGRTALGYGMHTEKMIEWLGIRATDRVSRVREAVGLMRRVWAGEVVAHEGREFHWSDQCYLRFSPVRDRIPVYVSGFAVDDLEMSGEIGDGSLPMVTPPESAALMVARIRNGIRRAGRRDGDVDICGCGWFSVTADGKGWDTDALKDIVAYFGNYLDEAALATVGLRRADFAGTARLVSERKYAEARAQVTPEMLRLAVTGGSDAVTRRIEALADAGITQISVGGPLGPDPRATIRLFGERIIPYFRG